MPIDDTGPYPKGILLTPGSGKKWVKCYICKHLTPLEKSQGIGKDIYKHEKCNDYGPCTPEK